VDRLAILANGFNDKEEDRRTTPITCAPEESQTCSHWAMRGCWQRESFNSPFTGFNYAAFACAANFSRSISRRPSRPRRLITAANS